MEKDNNMDFIFVSMPYAKFDSKWFSNVPNINLGILQSFLAEQGRRTKTFHFHTEFLPYLRRSHRTAQEVFIKLSEQFGVEYLGLDYVFASLLFEDKYKSSGELFQDRLASVGLTLNDFEVLRNVCKLFIEYAFSRLSPYLKGTKLIGFSCSHYQLSGSLLLCSKIKSVYPDIITVFGGKDCSGAFAHELLSSMEFVDFVGNGECEVTIISLLEHLNNGKTPCNVVFRNEKGEIKESESKPNFLLDSLPFPQYDFEDLPIDPRELIVPIELGRGCPWKGCTFCPEESYNIRCQSKSAKRIKEEMEYYQSISNYFKNFIILDSDALRNPKTVLELSQYLAGCDYSFHFATSRAEKIDREVLGALSRFGKWVSPFQVGIETFSDRVLHLMNKGVTVLKNVEVLKTAAELGIPLQFNLFTCYPKMTTEDTLENLKVMDRIMHLLVRENISIHPGEFYLPTDCPVFLHNSDCGLDKLSRSVFSYIFKDFTMPSYSNYPYPYQFDNEDEQFKISDKIRRKVDEINGKNPLENFMYYENSTKNFQVVRCRDGQRTVRTLTPREKEIYLSAIEESQRISDLSKSLNISLSDIRSILDDFDRQDLILYSSDQESFLSLAIKSRH
jgi:radical SAM superfamily enzyme YgiQ (UPF0313 family)